MPSRAYYNEIDQFCAGVLKRRIADGLLPPGDVDDRDIRSVQPADLAGYAQVHLFAGIGGFALAARLAGWPDELPLWTGGYPCQPFSVAGLRLGASDDRYLWPEVSRLLRSVEERPAWGLFENVDGHRDLGLDRTLFDLEALGYASRPFWIPACAVEAPHERMRVWIVARSLDMADATGERCREPQERPAPADRAQSDRDPRVALANASDGQFPESQRQPQGRDGAGSTGAALSPMVDATRERWREGWAEPGVRGGRSAAARPGGAGGDPWDGAVWIECADGKLRRTQPGLGLLAHGIPDRVARLRALGNAIVPEVAARILGTILHSEVGR